MEQKGWIGENMNEEKITREEGKREKKMKKKREEKDE